MAQNRKSLTMRLAALCLQFLLLLALLVQLLVINCALFYGYIPLPARQINGYLSTHSIHDLRLVASSYKLRIDGQIEAFDLQMFHGDAQKPMLCADNARLEWSIQTRRKPSLQFTGFVLSGGTLYQPAVHSPDGMHSTLLSELAIDLETKNGRIIAHTLCAKLDDWILRGRINLPLQVEANKEEGLIHPLDSFYKIASEILTQKKEHNYLKSPTVAFSLHSNDSSKFDIDLLFSTEAVAYSNTLIKKAMLGLSLQLDGKELRLHKPALLTGSHMSLPSHGLTAIDANCWIEINEIKELLAQRLPQIEFSAQSIQYEHNRLNQPIFRISQSVPEQIDLSGSVEWSGSVSKIEGRYHLEEKSGNLRASGKLHSKAIIGAFPEEVRKELPSLEFPEALQYAAEVDLDAGNQLKKVEFYISTENARIDNLSFDLIESKGRYQNEQLQLDSLDVYRNRQHIHAFIKIDTLEKVLNIFAQGKIQPKEYNHILPQWWSGIFKDFSFNPQSSVNANFAVNSAYQGKAATNFFGEVALQEVAYSQVPLEEAHIIVKGNPHHIHLDISEVDSPEGSFDGKIDLTRRQDGIPSLLGLHLDIETELSIIATRSLIGDLLYNRIVGDFTFTSRPKIKLRGSSYFTAHYPEYKGKTHFSFYADANGPLEYNGTPLEYLQFHGYSDDTVTQLRDVTFGYADGYGKGAIDISSRQEKPGFICVELDLNDADDRKAIENLPALDPLEDDFQTAEEVENRVPENIGSGSLDAYLHACGSIDNPYSYSGHGSFTIRDKQLGAIQLLGPLSMLLQGTALGFTSFELNEMSAKINLEEGVAHFTDLQVNGPLTRIEAAGLMKLDSHTLDMRVAVHLFGNTTNRRNPITKITDIVNPLSALLRFELGGTIEKQRWRSIYDPRKLIPGL